MNWSLLLGFVGGLAAVALKGAVDLKFDRRRERRLVQAAARLLANEFANAAIWANTVLDSGRWVEAGGFSFDHGVWHEHKASLASAAMPWTTWDLIASGHRDVGVFESYLENARRETREEWPRLTPDLPQLIGFHAKTFDRAHDALGTFAAPEYPPRKCGSVVFPGPNARKYYDGREGRCFCRFWRLRHFGSERGTEQGARH